MGRVRMPQSKSIRYEIPEVVYTFLTVSNRVHLILIYGTKDASNSLHCLDLYCHGHFKFITFYVSYSLQSSILFKQHFV